VKRKQQQIRLTQQTSQADPVKSVSVCVCVIPGELQEAKYLELQFDQLT